MRSLWVLVCVSALVLAVAYPSRAMAQQTAVLLPARGAAVGQDALNAATTSLRQALEARGLTVRETGAPSGQAATVADLGAVARGEGASYVVNPTLEDFAGMTSLRIRVVSSRDTLIGEATDLAAAETLPQDAERVLARAFPGDEAGPQPTQPTEQGLESPWVLPTEPAVAEDPSGSQEYGRERPRRRRRPREPELRERSFWLGALVEPAMGTNQSAFSLMVGGRAEYQWRGLIAGLNLDYTYLIDFEPRNEPDYHTVAVFPVLGYMISLGGPRFRLPIIASGGYIANNGGLLRFEAGLAYKATDRVDLRFIFVCPNFWFLGDRTVLFVSFSLQVLAGI